MLVVPSGKQPAFFHMSEIQIDLRDKNFTIGFPNHSMSIPTYTALSLVDSLRALDRAGVDINYTVELQNSIVDSARNNIVHRFLEVPEQQCLIFIDSDMVWTAEDLTRLCCWSTMYPIVAGMYSSKSDSDPKFLGDYWRDPELNQIMQNEYGLVKMTGIGLGFCAIRREVFETMKQGTKTYKDPTYGGQIYRFFSTTTDDGAFIGEDIYFLRRWTNEFGGELWIDPEIQLGHVGQKVYKGHVKHAMAEYNKKLLEG